MKVKLNNNNHSSEWKILAEIIRAKKIIEYILKHSQEKFVNFAVIKWNLLIIHNLIIEINRELDYKSDLRNKIFSDEQGKDPYYWYQDMRATLSHGGYERAVYKFNLQNASFYHFCENQYTFLVDYFNDRLSHIFKVIEEYWVETLKNDISELAKIEITGRPFINNKTLMNISSLEEIPALKLSEIYLYFAHNQQNILSNLKSGEDYVQDTMIAVFRLFTNQSFNNYKSCVPIIDYYDDAVTNPYLISMQIARNGIAHSTSVIPFIKKLGNYIPLSHLYKISIPAVKKRESIEEKEIAKSLPQEDKEPIKYSINHERSISSNKFKKSKSKDKAHKDKSIQNNPKNIELTEPIISKEDVIAYQAKFNSTFILAIYDYILKKEDQKYAFILQEMENPYLCVNKNFYFHALSKTLENLILHYPMSICDLKEYQNYKRKYQNKPASIENHRIISYSVFDAILAIPDFTEKKTLIELAFTRGANLLINNFEHYFSALVKREDLETLELLIDSTPQGSIKEMLSCIRFDNNLYNSQVKENKFTIKLKQIISKDAKYLIDFNKWRHLMEPIYISYLDKNPLYTSTLSLLVVYYDSYITKNEDIKNINEKTSYKIFKYLLLKFKELHNEENNNNILKILIKNLNSCILAFYQYSAKNIEAVDSLYKVIAKLIISISNLTEISELNISSDKGYEANLIAAILTSNLCKKKLAFIDELFSSLTEAQLEEQLKLLYENKTLDLHGEVILNSLRAEKDFKSLENIFVRSAQIRESVKEALIKNIKDIIEVEQVEFVYNALNQFPEQEIKENWFKENQNLYKDLIFYSLKSEVNLQILVKLLNPKPSIVNKIVSSELGKPFEIVAKVIKKIQEIPANSVKNIALLQELEKLNIEFLAEIIGYIKKSKVYLSAEKIFNESNYSIQESKENDYVEEVLYTRDVTLGGEEKGELHENY